MLTAALLAACAKPPAVLRPTEAPAGLVRVAPEDVPLFVDDMGTDGLTAAIDASLTYLRRVPDAVFRFGPDQYTAGHMITSLEAFGRIIVRRPDPDALRQAIAADFHVYRSTGEPDSGQVLFTGYYEPLLRGCERPGPTCPYPVYGRPADLVSVDLGLFDPKYQGEKIVGRWTGASLVPYWDRGDINRREILNGRAAVLAWVADPVELFFMQIQGSGRVQLDTGRTVRLNYDGTNGRPYRSIGKWLIDQGKIPAAQMSLQAIRAYLGEHPAEIPAVLNTNPSYVFFKTADGGPMGALNVQLTPGRSLASDRRLFPDAALAFVQAQKPVLDPAGGIDRWIPFSRFMLNQDTGGAIRGPGRADLFWGSGGYAQAAAGHLKHRGQMYFLVLKPGGP